MKILKFGDNKKYSFIYSRHQDSSSDDDITRAIYSAVSSQLKYLKIQHIQNAKNYITGPKLTGL